MKRPVESAKKGVDLGRWGYKTTRMGKILILGCPPPRKKNNPKTTTMFKTLLYLLLVLYI